MIDGRRIRVREFNRLADKAKGRHGSAFGMQERSKHVRGCCADAFVGGFGLKFSEGQEGVLVPSIDDCLDCFFRSSVPAP
jgi:hypothetical protein